MTDETLKALPLEVLLDLLFQGTTELLDALERKEPDEIELRAKQKQARLICDTILFKKEVASQENGKL